MKKAFFGIGLLTSMAVLSACSFPSGGGQTTPKGYDNGNISKVESSAIPSDIPVSEDVDYYTSKDLELSVEINGMYKVIKYFSLDPKNSDLRIYDEMYFYQYDFFQMMPPSASRDTSIYASLSDKSDEKYVEEHHASDGSDLQIDIKVSGIYKLIFDLKTLKFDIEYKREITTPKYYTIETCTFQVKNGDQTIDHRMTLNGEVFSVNDVSIDIGSAFDFTAINYVSDYKFTLAEGVENRFACFFMTKQYEHIYAKALIGGKYNVSINANTYVVSLELVSGVEQSVYCLKNGTENLTPSSEHPYIFEFPYRAERDTYSTPYFYNIALKKVILKPVNNDLLLFVEPDMVFIKKAGNYKLLLNALDLTIDAQKVE